MLEVLKEQVHEANMELPRHGLITYTQGNVSGIDWASGLFVTKPSGADCDDLRPEDTVVTDLEGNRVGGMMNLSSDTATRLELYWAFPEVGGVVHTYSPFVTSWVQAGRGIPCYGTIHVDYFYREIPCVRNLTPEEIKGGYGKNTEKATVETSAGKNPAYVLGVLCRNHGLFTWGKGAAQAIHNAVVPEKIAKTNLVTELLNPNGDDRTPQCMQDKHFLGKHGLNAYHGQEKKQL